MFCSFLSTLRYGLREYWHRRDFSIAVSLSRSTVVPPYGGSQGAIHHSPLWCRQAVSRFPAVTIGYIDYLTNVWYTVHMVDDTVHYAFTDGSSLGNPGPAGWAVLLDDKLYSGSIDMCTNNYAEMFAVMQAIKRALPNSKLEIYTDSKLIIGWFTQGYRIQYDHIRELKKESDKETASKGLQVTFHKVKGHSGDPRNNRVDIVARGCAENLLRHGHKRTEMTLP